MTAWDNKLTDADMHRYLRCEKCGHDRYSTELGYCDDDARPCIAGNCTEYVCRGCGHSDGGFGPVGCPCQRRIHSARRRRLERIARRRARRPRRRDLLHPIDTEESPCTPST